MNVVECYLDAYEQIYIHFAKYELFLIILTALPKFIITCRNADNKFLQAQDLHKNYTQLHEEVTVTIYDHTTLVMTQNPRDVMTVNCTETSAKATCYSNENIPVNTGGTFSGGATIGT
jgi:hypothetical protein